VAGFVGATASALTRRFVRPAFATTQLPPPSVDLKIPALSDCATVS
jgi:hypothetical protein